jgi:FkbM family methyltransferase
VYSLFARELVGESGRIWSFEPNSGNFARLNENVALNGYLNVTPIQKAVTRASGVVAFTVALDTGNAIAEYRLSGDIERGVEEVPATDLESAMPPGQFAMWKLDIEGAELDALKGGDRSIERRKSARAAA